MSTVNSLGQKIEVGSYVVLVSQGQGFAEINVGTVEKFSRNGFPQIKYLSGTISPPIQRFERLYVIDATAFDWHKKRHEIVEKAGVNAEHVISKPDFDTIVTEPYTYGSYGHSITPSQQRYREQNNRYRELVDQYQKDRTQFINDALEAAGMERTYVR